MISLASLARDHEKGIKEMVAVKLQTSRESILQKHGVL